MDKNNIKTYLNYPKTNFFQFLFYYLDLIAALCAIIIFAYEGKNIRLVLTFIVFILERAIQIGVMYYITKGQNIPDQSFEQIEKQQYKLENGKDLNVKIQKFSFSVQLLLALTYSDCAYYYYLSKKCLKNIEAFNIVTKIRGLFLSNLLAYIIATGYMQINDDNYENRKNEVAIYNITFAVFVFNFVINNAKVYLDVSSKPKFNWEIFGLIILIFIEFMVYLMWVTFVITKFKAITFVIMAIFGIIQFVLLYYYQQLSLQSIPDEYQDPNWKSISRIYKFFIPLEAARSLIFYVRYEDTTLDSIDEQDKLQYQVFTMRQKRAEIQTIALRILYILVLCIMMLTKKKWVEDFFEEYTVIAVATTITFLIVHTLIVAIKTYFQKVDSQSQAIQSELYSKHFKKQKKAGIIYPFYEIFTGELEPKQKQFDLEDLEKAKKKNQVLPQLSPVNDLDSTRQFKVDIQRKNIENSELVQIQPSTNLPKFRDTVEEKKDIDLVPPSNHEEPQSQLQQPQQQQPQSQQQSQISQENLTPSNKSQQSKQSKRKFLERKTPSYHDIDNLSNNGHNDSDFRKTEQGFRVNTQGSNQGSTHGGKGKKLKSNVDLGKLNKVSNMYDVGKSSFNKHSNQHKLLSKAEKKQKREETQEAEEQNKKTETTNDKFSKLQSSSTMDQQQQDKNNQELQKEVGVVNEQSPQKDQGEFFNNINKDEIEDFDNF